MHPLAIQVMAEIGIDIGFHTSLHMNEFLNHALGSVLRVAIPYVDPKVSDGTDAEARTYDERSRQIAREMFFLMKMAK